MSKLGRSANRKSIAQYRAIGLGKNLSRRGCMQKYGYRLKKKK
jgi:hypothetical protein